ncbi:MAG: type IV secretory system conjugative DNA transfer family protein, partial [Salinibacter sp.]|uniref:type IV secretory system conjugative DNA transfer family protein n=1 Tax=Salinibacter sp. TaxID=2065818 RepID=UPI0035D4356F
TLLTWLAFQDITDGQGVAFLTPEAETIEQDLLPHIPRRRRDDVIYFNPADERCRFSFNPLHRDPGDDIDRKVEAVFTSLTRLMESGSARINQILRQTIYALVELPDTTLLDIPRLLDRENPHYRKQVISRLEDEQTKHFWKSTYPGLPSNAHVPILTRLAKFIRPRSVRNVLCRSGQGLDFREVIDSGKILLCNLSDGLLGEAVSRILGGLIMSELQLAAVSRADVPESDRRRCYVYLDEFHSFTAHANVSYEKLLSRARKYRLPLTLAHQQTGQISTDLVREIFGNANTLVSFLVSRRDANRISRECIRDDVPGRQTVDPEELVTLGVGESFAKVGTHAFPMQVTATLESFEKDLAVKDQIIADSRRDKADRATEVAEAGSDYDSSPAASDAGDADVPTDPFADLDDPQDLY